LRVVIIGRSKRLIAAESGLRSAMRRQGHQVLLLDDRRLRQRIGRRLANCWLLRRAQAFRPERVIFFKNHDLDLDVLREIASGIDSVMWYRDLNVPPDPAILLRAREVDTTFITAGGQTGLWQAQGVKRALWLPNAADRDTDLPVPPAPAFACDIAFMGRGISPGNDRSRAELLVRLSQRFRVRVWGQQWEPWAQQLNWDGSAAYGADFARVCASAKIVIDIQPALWARAAYDELYSSNRMVKVMSCGGFSLSQGAPGIQKLFRDGEHCAWFASDDDAIAQIEKYLYDHDLRNRVRETGRDFVYAHHMLDNRVHNLLTGEPYQNPLAAA
jgi:hypothetical protein